MADKNSIYKILFMSGMSQYEIYAKHVSTSNLFGFIEISDLVFGKAGTVVVDPSEDKLRNEFSGVKRFYLPMHSVFRIDEVKKEGIAKIVELKESGGKVTPFPVYTPAGGKP